MTETFTELYPGVGGSKMDERLVPNTEAGGSAHRATMIPGDAEGLTQSFLDEDGIVKAQVKDVSLLAALQLVYARLADGAQKSQVTNFPATQPISAVALPLPSGAAEQTTLLAVETNTGVSALRLDSILTLLAVVLDIPLSDLAKETTLSSVLTALGQIYARQADGSQVVSDGGSSLTVDGPLTDGQLRASPVAVSGPLTDTELRATPVPVSGPLTDVELRATPVPVSGPLTDAQLRAVPVPVSGTVTATGPLTDAELRATPVPVSGTVTATGPLTDAELRDAPVPVSVATLPLPTDASTETTLAAALVELAAIRAEVEAIRDEADGGDRSGRATLANANTAAAVTSASYTEPSAAAQRSFASSSANDTAAGTGARTVEVTYFDNSCAGPFDETVTLNGVTAVATVNSDIRFIEKLIVTSFGSGNSNAGTITMYVDNAGGGGTITTIGLNVFGTGATVGDNQTYAARHYVAAGARCHITAINVSSTSSTLFILRTKDPTVSGSNGETLHVIEDSGGGFTGDCSITFTGPKRLILFAVPSSNNTTVTASISYNETP